LDEHWARWNWLVMSRDLVGNVTQKFCVVLGIEQRLSFPTPKKGINYSSPGCSGLFAARGLCIIKILLFAARVLIRRPVNFTMKTLLIRRPF
jgi:hypothetical protein